MSVRTDLDKRLLNWSESKTPKVPVAWEGNSFKKPPQKYFVETILLPADTINATLNGVRGREVGIYQINLWVPEADGCAGLIDILCNEIISYFPVVPKIGETSIERIPSAGRSESINGYRVTPITIQYRREF